MKLHLVVSIVLLLTAAAWYGCAPQKSASEITADQNKVLTTQTYDAMNADDWTKVGTLIAPDFIEHNPMPGQKPGVEGLKEMFAEFRASFPDMKMTADKIVAEGDLVVAHVLITGTNKGAFMGMPATGKSVSIDGYDMMRFADGKCVEHWGVSDNLAMMQQLGMMPSPGQPSEPEKSKKR